MLPINCGSHADYQNFVVTNLRKYYPVPDALARYCYVYLRFLLPHSPILLYVVL